MALLYCDGFDHYASASGSGNRLFERAPGLFDVVNISSTSNQNSHCDTAAMPELGGRGYRAMWKNSSALSNARWGTMRLPFSVSEGLRVGIGFHLYMGNTPARDDQSAVVGFGGPSSAADGGCIGLSAGSVLSWRPGTPSAEATVTGTTPLAIGALYHIEFQIYFHNSAGWVEVRVNGQTELVTPANIDTIIGTQTFLHFCPLASNVGGSNTEAVLFKNLYIYDDDTSDGVFDWLGERNVMTIPVASDESPQDWSLSGGSDAYALLDGVPPDPDNDYIESSSADDVSKFGIDALESMDISIVGVQTTVQAYKTGTSDTEILIGTESGGVLDASAHPLIQDQPTYFTHISTINPDTDDPYTPAELQSSLVHIERVL